MSFSEFGWRAGEKASFGTYLGTANTMYLFGKSIRDGLYGERPSLKGRFALPPIFA
jgi:uncharacterized protein (DUF1501 family)